MHIADLFARRGIDAQIIIVRTVAAADHCFCDHDPGIVMTKDAGILLVAGWVR